MLFYFCLVLSQFCIIFTGKGWLIANLICAYLLLLDLDNHVIILAFYFSILNHSYDLKLDLSQQFGFMYFWAGLMKMNPSYPDAFNELLQMKIPKVFAYISALAEISLGLIWLFLPNASFVPFLSASAHVTMMLPFIVYQLQGDHEGFEMILFHVLCGGLSIFCFTLESTQKPSIFILSFQIVFSFIFPLMNFFGFEIHDILAFSLWSGNIKKILLSLHCRKTEIAKKLFKDLQSDLIHGYQFIDYEDYEYEHTGDILTCFHGFSVERRSKTLKVFFPELQFRLTNSGRKFSKILRGKTELMVQIVIVVWILFLLHHAVT